MFRPTYVEINLDCLKSNYNLFASSSLGKIFMCPMVKANAYGHGDLQIVRHLESFGCGTFGVGLVEEGIRIREKGDSQSQILVFGFSGAEAAQELIKYNLTPVVSDWQQLGDLQNASTQVVAVHLKFNTGMNRLGFSLGDASRLFDFLAQNKIIKVVGVCTHLLNSDDLDGLPGQSRGQLEKFKSIIAAVPQPVVLHAYNTTGALRALEQAEIAQEFPYGLRPGLGMYGLASWKSETANQLQTVMSLKSKIVSTQDVKKGKVVSYGGMWTAAKDSTVAIVPVGYADGIPVQLSNKGHVLIGGKEFSIVGRVCMDYTLIDITGLESPRGHEVIFFGKGRTAHDVAEEAQTIPYDVLTRISERVPRVFVGEGC